jgi:hypothetical protein
MQSLRISSQMRWFLFFCGIAFGALLFLFYQNGDVAFISMDAPAWQLERMRHCLENSSYYLWYTGHWLGNRFGPISPDFNALILRYVSYPFSLNLLFSVNLFLGGIGFYILLRRLDLNKPACLFGAIAYLLTCTNVTLLYPGHVNKIMTAAWIPFSTTFFFTALRDRRIMDYLLSGAFLGLGLLGGEVQLPYYLGFWFSVWLLIFLIHKAREKSLDRLDISIHGIGLLFLAITSLVTGFSTTIHILRFMEESTITAPKEDPTSTWLFATQFYFPPQELLSYITTVQFFGGVPIEEFCYWGHDGEPTPLRRSDDYMGLLPLGFAFVGAIALWRLWQVRMFVITALISLLASFGKQGFVFWILYQLPFMKTQRNPHRWSYFVSFSVCALSAYGIHWFWEKLHEGDASKDNQTKGVPVFKRASRFLFWTCWFGIILFGLAFLLLNNQEGIARTYYGPGPLASPQSYLYLQRTHLILASLIRTGFFISISTASVWWLIFAKTNLKPNQPRWSMLAPLVLVVLVMATDLGMNDKRYFQIEPWKEEFFKSDLVKLLKEDPDPFRIKLYGFQQDFILSKFVSEIFPFHHIEVVDPGSASRIPLEYSELFDYMKNHYVRSERIYDFFNVKYVISLQEIKDPLLKLELIAKGDKFLLYRRQDFMPRAWLVHTARVVEDEASALSQTLNTSFPFRKSVILNEKPEIVPIDASVLQGASSAANSAEVEPAHFKSRDDNNMEIEASTTKPAILVLGEKWDQDWFAWLDGKPVKIYHADFVMRGIEVPAGNHLIRLEYRPSMSGFWISIFSLVLVFSGSFVFWLLYKYNKK